MDDWFCIAYQKKSVKSAELREEAKTITKNLCERSQKIANGPFICMQAKIWKFSW